MGRFTVLTLTCLFIPAAATAQHPRPGDVERLTVISLSLQAAGTREEAKRVTYTPPPGWHVRSHEVRCGQRRGATSFTVGTVPADWSSTADERAGESSRRLADVTAEAPGAGARARLRGEAGRERSQSRSEVSSHHALVVEASARGGGLFVGGAALELTVVAELVYVGEPAAARADGSRP
jgi:hypothetical protein